MITLDGMRGEDIGFKVYVNTPAAARPLMTGWIVQHIVDDPVRFPGVYAAKAAAHWNSGRTAS